VNPRRSLSVIAAVVLVISASIGGRAVAQTPAGTAPAKQPDDPRAEEGPSYSLFLPSTYTADGKWPILFCFDPGRRGMLPIELFRDAAERIGMIIVSANDFSSSGSTETSVETLVALWTDALARFPVDLDRVYAAGFSGGGRLCWLLAGNTTKIRLAGIIEAGAGFPWPELPSDFDASNFAFCGFVGETDFNYYEVQGVAEVLRRRGIPRRIVSFEGGHEWPSAAECCGALEWLQVVRAKKGAAPADTALISRVFEAEMAAGTREEREGRIIEARDRFLGVTGAFEGLRDLSDPRSVLERLDRSEELANLLTMRRREAERASTVLDRAVIALEEAAREGGDPPLYSAESLRREMGLDSLLLRAASPKREERLAAQRVLAGIHVRAAVYLPRALTRQGNSTAAAVMLELAVAIEPKNAADWHRLAQARARAGMAEGAIDALDKAVGLGLPDTKSLGTDPAFERLRNDPRFSALLARAAHDSSKAR
jgi:hypothetical protein